MNNNRKILLIWNSLPIRGAFGEVSVRFPDCSSAQRSVHLHFWSHRLAWGELLGETPLLGVALKLFLPALLRDWWQVGPSDRIAATSLPGARTPRGDTCQEPSAAARGLQQCQGDPGEGATPESCRENSFWPQKGQQEESSWPWGRHTSITRLLRCSLTVPAKPLMFLQRLPQPLLAWICLSCVLGATWTPRSHPAHTPSTPRLQPRSVLVRAPGMRRPHAATLKGTAPGTRLLSDQSGGNRA